MPQHITSANSLLSWLFIHILQSRSCTDVRLIFKYAPTQNQFNSKLITLQTHETEPSDGRVVLSRLLSIVQTPMTPLHRQTPTKVRSRSNLARACSVPARRRPQGCSSGCRWGPDFIDSTYTHCYSVGDNSVLRHCKPYE
jgi:hypothetical protein